MPGAYHQQFGIYIQVASHNPSLDELAKSHHLALFSKTLVTRTPKLFSYITLGYDSGLLTI
jgi:hypothetical protein